MLIHRTFETGCGREIRSGVIITGKQPKYETGTRMGLGWDKVLSTRELDEERTESLNRSSTDSQIQLRVDTRPEPAPRYSGGSAAGRGRHFCARLKFKAGFLVGVKRGMKPAVDFPEHRSSIKFYNL